MAAPLIPDDLLALVVPVESLQTYATNPRRGDVEAIAASLSRNGQYRPIVVNRGTHTGRPNEVLAGNHTLAAARLLEWPGLAVTFLDVTEEAAARIVLADNRTAELGGYDDALLLELLQSIPDFDGTGWDQAALDAVLGKMDADRRTAVAGADAGPSLADRFLVPPFTTFDARSGTWQARKREWFAAGLRSDLGRDGELAYQGVLGTDPTYYTKKRAAEAALGRPLTNDEFRRDFYVAPDPRTSAVASGTSLFDPVLCEIAVRWYSPPGGLVVDPWAGGSVRGLVATRLGRRYTGVELRAEQVAANRAQVEPFLGASWRGPRPEWIVGDAATELPALAGTADMVLGCPPYFDLEGYSDDPADLSNLSETEFLDVYGHHLELAYRALKPDRFAFMFLVVGSVRDKTGRLRDLRSATVIAAERAGFQLYNDGILLTAVGSASIRVARSFKATRVLGRVHQDILVFVKGDRRAATAAVGSAEVEDALLDVLYDVNTVGDPDLEVPPVGMPTATPLRPEPIVADPKLQTPVQRADLPAGGSVYLKRDDAFQPLPGGSRGGKVRACQGIVLAAGVRDPVLGLVTAGSRQSPQVNIVAETARALGIPCRVHVPAAKGGLTPELAAAAATGAEVVEHRPGHNSVIVARAREDAAARGWLEVPFGMEHEANLDATAAQLTGAMEFPDGRLVVPVGSGMTLAGVLRGLHDMNDPRPVLAVQVGADPSKRLDRWAPGWRSRVELVKSPLDYHAHAVDCVLDGVMLDPVYEAKCLPFLRAGDVLWIVGRRATVVGEETP